MLQHPRKVKNTLLKLYGEYGTWQEVSEVIKVNRGLLSAVANGKKKAPRSLLIALGLYRRYPPYLKIRRDDMEQAAESILRNLPSEQVDDLIWRLRNREQIT